MPNFNSRVFWNYASVFFKYLNDSSQKLFENFWEGISKSGNDLSNQANRFLEADSPEGSQVMPTIDYYEIIVGPLYSKPLYLNPTDKNSGYTITPLSYLHKEGSLSGQDRIFNDIINISNEDYYKIRSIGIGMYVVVNVNNDDIETKFFKIKNLLSSEELVTSDRYIKPYDINNPNTYRYQIELENCNLFYIKNNNFTIYLTNAKIYKVDNYIEDITEIQTAVNRFNENGTTNGYVFTKGQDFDYKDGFVEFYNNIVDENFVKNGDIIYSLDVDTIENNLYDMYGTLVNIHEWRRYGHTNVSGKAAINSLLSSLQNISNIQDYRIALQTYYGVPGSPQDALVLGLYESYNYEVINIVSDTITVELKSGEDLHKFIQAKSKLYFFNKDILVKVDSVNRSSGEITLIAGDATGLEVGDKFNIKLLNRMNLKEIYKDEINGSIMWVDLDPGNKDHPLGGDIHHIIDVVKGLSLINNNVEAYPEILVYGTENGTINYNGIYHVTDINTSRASADGLLGLVLSDAIIPGREPLYNDYIEVSNSSLDMGFVHIPWPTHKYIFLFLKEDGSTYKAYLDSPLDTVYDKDDIITKYDVISRSLSVMNRATFENWNEFDGFKYYNGLHLESNTIELINTIPYATFGEYFPESYV